VHILLTGAVYGSLWDPKQSLAQVDNLSAGKAVSSYGSDPGLACTQELRAYNPPPTDACAASF